MKRLFDVEGEFFEKKDDAKAYRDVHAKGAAINLGPDHWRYGNAIHAQKAKGNTRVKKVKKGGMK